MSTLSQFFGSASGAGGAQTTSTMRVFSTTGSITLPSDTVYAAYGALGAGDIGCLGIKSCIRQGRSGGGGGFAFKEGAHAGAGTICAIVGAAATVCACCLMQISNKGGATCITGFDPGTICAKPGNCCLYGCGVGGDINTCGGKGGHNESHLGGGGAGGLYGNGGNANRGPGGGGFGSGGGGGGGRSQCYGETCGEVCEAIGCVISPQSAFGGGGGQPGSCYQGGHGLAGQGGMSMRFRACCPNGGGSSTQTMATGGYIPQYGRCGYSQAKTYFAAAGGGGAGSMCRQAGDGGELEPMHGAPGGGGGGASHTNAENNTGGNGGFGAGSGSGAYATGIPGFGGGGAVSSDNCSYCGTVSGQGVAVVEYWVG